MYIYIYINTNPFKVRLFVGKVPSIFGTAKKILLQGSWPLPTVLCQQLGCQEIWKNPMGVGLKWKYPHLAWDWYIRPQEWLILMVNSDKYNIHGSFGIYTLIFQFPL